MDICEDTVEEQDPDYPTPGPSNRIQHQKLYEEAARANTSRKINAIIEKEFTQEIDTKENEILLIQNRLNQALKTLHLLRYVIITDFYNRKQCILQPPPGTDSKQTRIHPAIKQIISQAPTNISTLLACTNTTNNKNQQSNSETTTFSYPTIDKINENELQQNGQSSNDGTENNSKKRDLETCETNSNGPLKKIPRYIPPKYGGPEPQIPSRGERHKSMKRIVVGNISKWISSDCRDDMFTHKWTMYVRGSKEDAKIDDFVAKVCFLLHSSYQPNDRVEVTSPPFHLSRRGYGEFPVRVRLFFKNTANKPIDIIHNLKLDRTHTGLQTLGSETVVDIWIKNKDSFEQSQLGAVVTIKKEEIDEIDDEEINVQENNVTIEENSSLNENKEMIFYRNPYYDVSMDHDYINFYQFDLKHCQTNDSDDLNVNINNMTKVNKYGGGDIKSDNLKKINRNCNKLKPLEIIIPPRFQSLKSQKIPSQSSVKQILVLNKNQMIPINLVKNNGDGGGGGGVCRGGGASLLKFNINPSKSILLDATSDIPALRIAQLPIKIAEKTNVKGKITVGKDKMKITTKRQYYENILKAIDDVNIIDIESLMRFIIKRIPLINENASDPEYRKIHPYVCPSEKEFLNYNVGKQRALEWYRAKAVNEYLKKKCHSSDQVWTIKEIMIWCRLHGNTPSIGTTISSSAGAKFNSQSSKTSTNKIPGDICERICLNTATAPLSLVTWQKNTGNSANISCQIDDLIDVVSIEEENIRKKNKDLRRIGDTEVNKKNVPEIIEVPRNILPIYSFVCNTARVIGIRIEPEELAPGISHCAAARLIIKSVECLLEDILRSSMANAWEKNGRCPDTITLEDVRGALLNRDEFDIFTNAGLMDTPPEHEGAADDD